jgi:predicted transcriptional regulator
MRPSIVKDPHVVKQVRAMRLRGESVNQISRRLGISRPTVSKIVKKHRITPLKQTPAWMERLRARRQELRQRIAEAPRNALPWTASEEAWLIENASNTNAQLAALHLGRTDEAVRKKAQLLGAELLISTSWTKDEDDYLRNYFDRKSIKEMAKHLDRGYYGVRKRMIALGLGTKLDQIDNRITAQDIALRLGVDVDASREWMRLQRFPCELVGKWLVTDEGAVTEWLKAGHILRADRAALDYRDRLLYDRVLSEHYTTAYLRSLDVPALSAMNLYVRDEEGRRLLPQALRTGVAPSAETTYYRKRDVWAWCYYVGHVVPETIADPDLADVMTAWLTEFVTTLELRKYIAKREQNHWGTNKGFPQSVIRSRVYNRAEVVTWLRAHGKHDIAHRLTRGAILCYDDLIRDRRSRSKVVQ